MNIKKIIQEEKAIINNLLTEDNKKNNAGISDVQRINGIPCIGPLGYVANDPSIKIKGVIILNYSGRPASVIITNTLKKIPDNLWESNDKGSAAFLVFGNENNQVLYACAGYDGDKDSTKPYENSKHYYFDSVKNLTYAWG